jgi:DNA-binding response OmpR family regulator
MQEGAPGAGAHVLAVDDDPLIRQMIVDYLGDYDFRATAVATGAEMAEVLSREPVDLLLLDLRLPGEDGLQIARRLREESDLGIIVVTGRREEADRVMALELGADDYLTKPFSPRELLARVRALLRRTQMRNPRGAAPPAGRAYRFAGWQLNVPLHKLTSPTGEVMSLSNGEFNLLRAFLTSAQRILTRAELLSLSRLHDDEVYDRSIDVQVGRLRKKLDVADMPSLIQTERGAGYIFTAAVEVVL